MKFTDRPKWKRVILALLCIVGLLALAGGSYAAYSSQAYQRGVARNRDSESARFASNYLQNCAGNATESNYVGQTVLFTEDQKKNTQQKQKVDIYIYNYINDNAGLVSQRDITYDLDITFKDGSGSGYSIAPEGEKEVSVTDNTCKFNGRTLLGRKARYHKYTVSFPGADIDTLKIVAVATTKNLSSNQKIAAVIAPCTSSMTQEFVYKGDYIDKSANPSQYDGFNYEISISSGTATGTLTWEKDKVEIDKFFLKKIGKTEEEIKTILQKRTLRLTMSQSEGTGDYVIPFYIKNKSTFPTSKTTWDDMEKTITFKAVQSTTTQISVS